MASCRQLWALIGLVALDVVALAATVSAPGRLIAGLAAPHAWVARAGSDAAALTAAAAGLFACAVWLAVGLASAVAGRVPGVVGRGARLLARRLLPAVVVRMAAGAAGVGIVLSPVAATAASSHAGLGAAPAQPTPAWPTDNPLPAPAWPSTPSHPSPSSLATPTPPPRVDPSHHALGGTRTVVVVRTGDSLWRLAADRLGQHGAAARVAAAWPRWYAANRAVIGPDPNLIRPGEVLHIPAARPAGGVHG
jgi:nucleoid-associated protein YgaU